MSMLTERLQILIEPEQRQRLEGEAKRRNTSVASLVREAVDARFKGVSRSERLKALKEIQAIEGSFVSPSELNSIVEQERADVLKTHRRSSRS